MVHTADMKVKTAAEPAKSKALDSEKITINLGFVDLGHIDLLVADGHVRELTDHGVSRFLAIDG